MFLTKRTLKISIDLQTNSAISVREGKEVIYPDFPEELDVPGDLETMLWKVSPSFL